MARAKRHYIPGQIWHIIQTPRKKSVLIAYKKLAKLAGFESYESFRGAHKELVDELLIHGKNGRQTEWT